MTSKEKHSPLYRTVSLRSRAVTLVEQVVKEEQEKAIPRWNSTADFVHEAINDKLAAVEAMHARKIARA